MQWGSSDHAWGSSDHAMGQLDINICGCLPQANGSLSQKEVDELMAENAKLKQVGCRCVMPEAKVVP